MSARRVVMGLQFFPRGGSAQVTRYLMAALRDRGCAASLVAGSLGSAGQDTHAGTFFAGLDVTSLDYTAASTAYEAGGDPLAAAVPMHPSYEDRADVADCLLAAVSPRRAANLATVWEAPFEAAGTDRADVVHLHHLTAQHDAVARRWSHLPLVIHLHGTELKFLEAVDERIAVARALGGSLATMPGAVAAGQLGDEDLDRLDDRQRDLFAGTRWSEWRHGEHWRTRLVAQARAADHLVTVSAPDRSTAVTLLGVDPDRVTAITNGVETDRFRPRPATPTERRARFRHWLVDDPQGWDATGRPGTVRYTEADLDRLLGPDGTDPVLVYVGRFTDAKRVPLLIRAFAKARAQTSRPVSLLIWGGHPGGGARQGPPRRHLLRRLARPRGPPRRPGVL